jgi:hypothetical protein
MLVKLTKSVIQEFRSKTLRFMYFKNLIFIDKTYHSPEEENNRKGIFAKNLDKIKTHNAAGIHSYTLAMNHLGDLTPAEVKKMRGYRKPSNRMVKPNIFFFFVFFIS